MERSKGASLSCPRFKLDYFHQYLETIDGVLRGGETDLRGLASQ